MSQESRAVAQIVKPEPVIEGAGVHLRRSIGTRRLDHLDPFLLLDHFESARPEEYEPGFPNERLFLHLLKIRHYFLAPLCAISAVTNSAFAELVCDFHFQP